MARNDLMAAGVALILLLGAAQVAEAGSGLEQRRITVVFRYDDYSSLSPTDLELKLIAAFQERNVPCTFGVIPYVCAGPIGDPRPQEVMALTAEKARILKDAAQAGVVEVAMHGYSHQRSPARAYTEFAGLDRASQLQRIESGKRLLEDLTGVRVTTFIPPWNSYDLTTLRVLEDVGVTTLSASGIGVTERLSRLRFVPSTCDLVQLRDAIRSARGSTDPQPVIVVLFHPFDFLEHDARNGKLTLAEFVELLRWSVAHEDVQPRTVGGAAERLGGLDWRRFLSYSQLSSSRIPKLMPSFLRQRFFGRLLFYPTLPVLRWGHVRCCLIVGCAYLVLLAVSSAAGLGVAHLALSRLAVLELATRYGLLLLLGALSLYVLHDRDVYLRGAVVLTGLVGVSAGVWASWYGRRRKDKRHPAPDVGGR